MMMQATGLVKRFGALNAVDQVDLTLVEGEIVGLTGPDGAGKTTLLRLLTKVLPMDAGSVVMPENSFGYMPQRFSLYGEMSVRENLMLMARLNGVSDQAATKRIEQLLTMTYLWPFRERLADNLSGGMKQKLSLAACLLHQPKLLLLDEPTTGVDPVSRREFWQLLYQMNLEGMTILVATPYMDEAEYCHRVAFMANGRLNEPKRPMQLKADYPYQLLTADYPATAAASVLAPFKKFIVEIQPMGAKTHVAVSDAALFISAWTVAHPDEAAVWRRTEPSLEDVFLAMLEAPRHVSG